MREVVDPLLQVRVLQELAAKLPPGSTFESSLLWENDHGAAGVTIGNGKCVVFLFDAEATVESLSEAGEMLKAIFADELATVRAYANEVLVYGGLAPTDAPSSGFHVLDRHGAMPDMPKIDCVTIETWSRGMLRGDE